MFLTAAIFSQTHFIQKSWATEQLSLSDTSSRSISNFCTKIKHYLKTSGINDHPSLQVGRDFHVQLSIHQKALRTVKQKLAVTKVWLLWEYLHCVIWVWAFAPLHCIYVAPVSPKTTWLYWNACGCLLWMSGWNSGSPSLWQKTGHKIKRTLIAIRPIVSHLYGYWVVPLAVWSRRSSHSQDAISPTAATIASPCNYLLTMFISLGWQSC